MPFSNSWIRFSSSGTVWDFNSKSWTWFKLDDKSSLVVFSSKTRLRLKKMKHQKYIRYLLVESFYAKDVCIHNVDHSMIMYILCLKNRIDNVSWKHFVLIRKFRYKLVFRLLYLYTRSPRRNKWGTTTHLLENNKIPFLMIQLHKCYSLLGFYVILSTRREIIFHPISSIHH